MLAAFLLAAAPPSPPPSAARIAEARAELRRQAEEQRAAIDSAIGHYLIGGGYFQLVKDKAEQRTVVAGLQKRLRSLGIPATIGGCDWMGLVAEGVADGNLSYGAACRVRMGSKSAADYLICSASLGGISLIRPDVYAWSDDYIELFIRRTCI